MSCTIIVGAQWGDEGKGKITSYYSHGADLVARFQGGPNAGHTVLINGKTHIFRIVPSGFLQASDAVIGNGTVINIQMFLDEMKTISDWKPNANEHIWISDRTHVILPSHIAKETSALNKKIGTTKMGIGPTYVEKIRRAGVRVIDLLLDPSCIKNEPAEYKKICKDFIATYKDQIIDTASYVNKLLDKKGLVICEGAQGALLDIDNGNYPFVTSSNTTASAACSGLGISPRRISKVYLVSCSYTTKVGGGPFPTHIKDRKIESYLQTKGKEIDGATHMLRDCGWLDLIMLKRAVILNKPDGLILTKFDILSSLKTLQIATSYQIGSETTTEIPPHIHNLYKAIPQYRSFKGWTQNVSKCTKQKDLPMELCKYLRFIQKFIDTQIVGISVGPDDAQYISISLKNE